ncbi:MAG: hypothetical protein CMJ75_04120 [Planctomycetaceae bacterium]|nr:hypothetical protein [Planctomycetaceae bacterium]
MSQVLQMQSQLMQGFLISENRLKKKQEELNQEVDAQVTLAQETFDKKRQKAEIRKEQSLASIQKESEKTFASLKQYRDFASNVQQELGKLSTLNFTQDPKKVLTSTSQKLTQLHRDIQSGRLVDFEAICHSVSSLIDPTTPLQKEVKTTKQNYIQQKARLEQEITRQKEEFVLSILLMVVSAGLIVSMIWFVG